MQRSPWRFEVKVVDHRILAHYIKFRGSSYAKLAAKAGCSKATVGHLATGHVKTTRPEWAKVIEKELDAPQGSLFVPVVSRVSEDAA